jgi:NHLM bacteriocin system ABC transporter ATP-binding protein
MPVSEQGSESVLAVTSVVPVAGANGQMLRGNTPLLLQGRATVWVVDSGAVAVFKTRVEKGKPVGRRNYLFGCQRGEALFCDCRGDGAEPVQMVAVALEEARLREVPLAEFAESLRETPPHSRDMLEKWVQKVTNIVAADRTVDQAVSPGTASRLRLSPGQVFRCSPNGVSWVRLDKGWAHLFGLDNVPVGPEAGAVPLGASSWLKAEVLSELRLQTSSDVASEADLVTGLGHLHTLCFTWLAQREQTEAEQEAVRLQERRRQDEVTTAEALGRLRQVLHPQELVIATGSDLTDALAAIGREIGVEFKQPGYSTNLQRVENILEPIAQASRVRVRQVLLRGEWWLDDCGPLLAYRGAEKRPVALLRTPAGRYEIFDPREKVRAPLTPAVRNELAPTAAMFYPPFPDRPLTLMDLPRLGVGVYWRELVFILLLAFGGAVLGMLTPQATRWIFDFAIPDADHEILFQFALALIAVACGQAVFQLSQGIITLRIRSGATGRLQAATWDRLLRLPTQFFRRFNTGDLLNRAMMITEVSQEISGTMLRSLLTGALSLLNLGLLFYYSTKLAIIALVLALVSSVVTGLISSFVRKKSLDLQRLDGRQSGFVVQLINGISKLRVAGGERRAYNQWAKQFAKQLRLTSGVQLLHDLTTAFNFALPTIGSLAIYYFAVKAMLAPPADATAAASAPTPPLTMGTFLAFNAAFGTFISGATSVSNTLVDIMGAVAKRKLMQPLLEAEVEAESSRIDPGRLTGAVHVDNVVFRYQEDSPLVLNGVSVAAEPGEFIAVVGPSGCGKSTLFRLLLGFEKPESGKVYYDGQDLSGLDLTAVRRQIGVVLQAGRINTGSIVDNIAAGNVVTLDEVWEAIRDAGMEADIKQMPMSVHTVISEGGGNLSGGQRQRLMIARALVVNPKIMFFDEATAALDNTTQRIVNESIARRKVTRVVVAHRLSTIQDADRIYVIEKGRVVQVGTFAELAAQEGLFKRMVQRQLA